MRAVAIVAAYNEERFIGGCIEHLVAEGLAVYVIDNGSTDATGEICSSFLGRGVLAVEDFPRDGVYSWRPLLERKAELAATLDADWFVHVDADEIRSAPAGWGTLTEGLARAEREGANAVNFLEFTFVPCAESPDHDHPRFRETMRWYYPFAPRPVDRLTAWKKLPGVVVDLASSGGHQVAFPGLRMHPEPFVMRHYLFLSEAQARSKYVERAYDRQELADGWHRARAALQPAAIVLPPKRALREVGCDGSLDGSRPRATHCLFDPDWLDKGE